jgi:hypothetical protein
MKKLLGLTLTLASLGMTGVASETKAADQSPSNVVVEANASPQWQRDRDYHRGYYRGRGRTVRQTRIVRFGRRMYRETYVVTYRPNGRTDTRLVSRVRIS